MLYWLPEFNIGMGQHFLFLSCIDSGKFYLKCLCFWTDASCSKLHKMLCYFVIGSINILHQHWYQICISLQRTSRIEVLVSVLALLVPCNIGKTLSNSIHDIFFFGCMSWHFLLFLLHLQASFQSCISLRSQHWSKFSGGKFPSQEKIHTIKKKIM